MRQKSALHKAIPVWLSDSTDRNRSPIRAVFASKEESQGVQAGLLCAASLISERRPHGLSGDGDSLQGSQPNSG
jgi:hypothetical protein